MFAQFVTAILARPYGQLIPALAVNVLHAGARGLGWAVSAIGIGGFGGALVTAYFAQRERRSMLWLQSGLHHVGRRFRAGLRADARRGVAGALCRSASVRSRSLGATNTLIQMLSPDDVRGRALSIYTMIAIGVVPLGALVDGAIAAVIGLRPTFALAGALCAGALSRDLVSAARRQDCVRRSLKESESRKVATR